MEIRDVIAGALDILADEKNWVKGSEDRVDLDQHGQVTEKSCLWGAFKRAITPGYYSGVQLDEEELIQATKLACDAAEMVGTVIHEQYPDRADNTRDYDNIIPFNDHEKTIHAEVVAVLEKALVR